MPFPPFYFYIPHTGLESLWDYIGLSGVFIICIALALTALTIFLLRRGFNTWTWIYLYFAIAGVIPSVGTNIMVLDNYSLIRTITRSVKQPDHITGNMWEICQIGFLADSCFLYTLILGALLVLRKLNRLSVGFKKT